jgi:hypothetical protein
MISWQKSPPFGRRKTLIGTLELLARRRAEDQVIVEIGTSEAYSPDGLGNALLAFGFYCRQVGGSVHAVDIREGAIQNSGAILREHYPHGTLATTFHRADAFEYAAFANDPAHDWALSKIDLIYYDGPSEPASWYVDLHERLAHLFGVGALALFDDTEPLSRFAGKGAALIPDLLNNGWRLVPVDGEPVFPMVLLEKT